VSVIRANSQASVAESAGSVCANIDRLTSLRVNHRTSIGTARSMPAAASAAGPSGVPRVIW
jgi:hypothetical protein